PVADLSGFLDELKQKYGTEIAIDVSAYRTVSVKDVIDVFDACQIAGFDQTRVRLGSMPPGNDRSEEHTSELQSRENLVCRLLLDSPLPDIYHLSLHDALPISGR